jgi:hypothetical protein
MTTTLSHLFEIGVIVGEVEASIEDEFGLLMRLHGPDSPLVQRLGRALSLLRHANKSITTCQSTYTSERMKDATESQKAIDRLVERL